MKRPTRETYIEIYGLGRRAFIEFAYSEEDRKHNLHLKRRKHFEANNIRGLSPTLVRTVITMSSGNTKVIHNAYNAAIEIAYDLVDRHIDLEENEIRSGIYKQYLTKRQKNKVRKIYESIE